MKMYVPKNVSAHEYIPLRHVLATWKVTTSYCDLISVKSQNKTQLLLSCIILDSHTNVHDYQPVCDIICETNTTFFKMSVHNFESIVCHSPMLTSLECLGEEVAKICSPTGWILSRFKEMMVPLKNYFDFKYACNSPKPTGRPTKRVLLALVVFDHANHTFDKSPIGMYKFNMNRRYNWLIVDLIQIKHVHCR